MNRKALFLGLAVLLLGCERNSSVLPSSTVSQPSPPPITLPQQHQAKLAPGERHLFEIALEQGQALHLVVQQQGVDIALSIGPESEPSRVLVDAPTAGQGPEELWFLADRAGVFLVSIHAGGRTAGSYQLKRSLPNPADAEFQARLAAFEFTQNLPEKPSLDDLERRVVLWQKTTHARETGVALFNLAEKLKTTDLPKALVTIEAAWLLLREHNHPIWALYVGNWLAHYAFFNGDLNRADNQWQSVHALARIHGDPWWQAFTLKQLGTAAHARQHFVRAITFYKEALALFQRVKDSKYVAEMEIQLAQTLIVVGRLAEAHDALDRAEAVYGDPLDPSVRAAILLQRGWLFFRQKQYTQAESMLQKGLALKRAHEGEALTYGFHDRLGSLYRAQFLWQEAQASYEKALALLEGTERADQRAMVRTNMARSLAMQGRFDEIDLRDSLDVFSKLNDAEGLAEVHSILAEQALDREQPLDALVHYEAALAAFDKARGSGSSAGMALPYIADRFALYGATRDLLFELDTQYPQRGYGQRALALIERVRARTLRESLAGEQNKQEEARVLQEAVNQLELQRMQAIGENHDAQVKTLGASIRSKLFELSLLKPKWQPAPAIDLAEIRAELLDADRRLLVYALGEPMSHVLVVGPNSLTRHALPAGHRLRTGVGGLMNAVTGHNPVQTRLLSRKLGQDLLQPILAEIAGKSLMIVKDDGLHGLPFAMLRHPKTDRFLVQEHVLTELPSASVGVYLKRRAQAREAELLPPAIFADPVYPTGGVARLPEVGNAFGVGVFRELPWSAREAEALAKLVPEANLFLRHQASREQLLTLEGQRRGVLHFAVHGLLHEQEQLSGLVLSLEDNAGFETAGFLRVHQLERLNLPVDLVVLSACQTAQGKAWRGEGPIGPGRAFLTAGANHVVMSLWRIRDGAATVGLMQQFYQGLLEQGMAPPQALQQAQISMIEQDVQPYAWASFLLMGPPGK